MVRDDQLDSRGSHPVQIHQRGFRGRRDLGGGSESYVHCTGDLRDCCYCEFELAVLGKRGRGMLMKLDLGLYVSK